MSNDDDTTIDIRGLEAVIRALKAKRAPQARVGVLGANASAPHVGSSAHGGGKTLTCAQVGAQHEYGTHRLPVRSFLRLPLSALLQKELDKAGAFDRTALEDVVRQGSFVAWVRKMAVVAESIVIGAFETGGYGTWVPSDMRKKKVKMTLVETRQLSRSITSEVIE